MYENRATMTTTFANQAHNDPLQLILELVSTLAVILHSFVDYPIRTIALASFMAFNVAYASRMLRD